jgi:hypothetical protein
MNRAITTALGLVAGFIGGAMSHYLFVPMTVQAQAQSPTEVRAQKFVLVDKSGASRGAFGIETDGTVQIEITDNKGRPYLYQTYNYKFFSNAPMQERRPKVLSLLH